MILATIADIPEWLGTAICSAVAAILGFFGKNLWDWWSKQHESKRERRSRLEKLERLLIEAGNLFDSQRSQALRHFESIKRSQPDAIRADASGRTPSLDQVFSRAFPRLTKEELQLHAIIRGVTQTVVKRVNQEMADWLKSDDWFKQAKHHSDSLNKLASWLQKLELHLNEWHAKFSSLFEKDHTLALNYLADEQDHGTGFPIGIESVASEALKGLN